MKPAANAEEILGRLEMFGIRLGLDNMRRVLAALGQPQGGLPAVLVAGTNGKGSTAAYLQAIARAAGYRTGFYTSPHLESATERLRLDGQAIGADRLGELLARIVASAERSLGHPPTYFEALTAAAFLWFAEEQVELAVVEVGMGGRLDATNTCEPLLAVVTEIALDHQEYLGSSLAAIAAEKAGVFRPGRPALAWASDATARTTLAAFAREVGAYFESVPDRTAVTQVEEHGLAGQTVTLATPVRTYRLATALLGWHQARNLALAVRAAETLRDLGWERLDAEAVERGAAACRWPGRLEPVHLPDGRQLLLDGAHNPAGVAMLADFLDRHGADFDLLFGALADKEIPAMLHPLVARAKRVTLTKPASSRAAEPADLAALVPGRSVTIEAKPVDALSRALDGAENLLLICGSLYLVGELRGELRRRYGVPAGLERI
jgi:dihydrofolate synthase / folylpolyglutamate synthase